MKSQKIIIELFEDSNVNIDFDPPAIAEADWETSPDDEKQLQVIAGALVRTIFETFTQAANDSQPPEKEEPSRIIMPK